MRSSHQHPVEDGRLQQRRCLFGCSLQSLQDRSKGAPLHTQLSAFLVCTLKASSICPLHPKKALNCGWPFQA